MAAAEAASTRLFPQGFGANAITRDGRLVTALLAPDTWYGVPGIIDLKTGAVTRIAVDYPASYWFLSWTPDGQIQATAATLRSSLWKFTAEPR